MEISDHPWFIGLNVQKLQQYGLQMPKTTADFEHVLQVFKQHGLTPLTGAAPNTGGWHTDPTTFLMNSFIYDDGGDANGGNYFYIDNGKIAFSAIQPQWKAGLQYMHRLYSEGLFDQGAFSQANSALEKLAATKSVGVVPWGCPQCFDPNYSKDVSVWRSLAPLYGCSACTTPASLGTIREAPSCSRSRTRRAMRRRLRWRSC